MCRRRSERCTSTPLQLISHSLARASAARFSRSPLVLPLTAHGFGSAGACTTSCAGQAHAGGAAEPLRAAEPKWTCGFLCESRRAEIFTSGSLLLLWWPGWVVGRDWPWLRAIPLSARPASGFCDVEHGTGRRGPLEQPARMGAGVTPWPDTSCTFSHALTPTRWLRVADAAAPSSASRCDLSGGLCGAGAAGALGVVSRSFELFAAAQLGTAPRSAPARPSY